MAQYQSFPGAPGDSLTLDKLKALRLPEMAGKSFLDVGCNEGFFCGFAKFQGATRVVGQDHSAGFVARAAARFPECEFHEGDWGTLPPGPFDIILLASALHYATDQEALIHRLVDMLSDNGVLILELGIVTSKASEWVSVQRGSDLRDFPTMPLLRELLKPYAWKWMGPSVETVRRSGFAARAAHQQAPPHRLPADASACLWKVEHCPFPVRRPQGHPDGVGRPGHRQTGRRQRARPRSVAGGTATRLLALSHRSGDPADLRGRLRCGLGRHLAGAGRRA